MKQHCGAYGNTCAGTATCRNGACVAGGTYREVRRWDGSAGGATLEFPTGITVDRTGNVYVADFGSAQGQIARFTANGDYIRNWTTGVTRPRNLDISPAGVIYVANTGENSVTTYSRDGKPGGISFPLPADPSGVALGLSGDVYVATEIVDPGDDHTGLHIYTARGKSIASWIVGRPFGVAVAPNGDLYVTDPFIARVTWLSPTGATKGAWDVGGGVDSAPVGITVDAAGFVYVADFNAACVWKFTANGSAVSSIGDSTVFSGPQDVAVSRTGMVYVVDRPSDSVVQFEPA